MDQEVPNEALAETLTSILKKFEERLSDVEEYVQKNPQLGSSYNIGTQVDENQYSIDMVSEKPLPSANARKFSGELSSLLEKYNMLAVKADRI